MLSFGKIRLFPPEKSASSHFNALDRRIGRQLRLPNSLDRHVGTPMRVNNGLDRHDPVPFYEEIALDCHIGTPIRVKIALDHHVGAPTSRFNAFGCRKGLFLVSLGL